MRYTATTNNNEPSEQYCGAHNDDDDTANNRDGDGDAAANRSISITEIWYRIPRYDLVNRYRNPNEYIISSRSNHKKL